MKTRGALASACLVMAACGSMATMPAPESVRPSLADVTHFRAGVAEVDITPPIGLGLFGHGPESRVATGTQLRLRCQVFVLEGRAPDARSADRVALVPCDLSAPSLLLQRKIAERVQANRVPLGADRIVLMATHTHMAPAHYFGVENYTGPFSSRLVGFDSGVLDFLADKIAGAIEVAYRNLAPAQLATKQVVIGDGLSRNRSFSAFMRNPQRPAWIDARMNDHKDREGDFAVDPTLSILRIDRALPESDPTPIGVLAIYGVHPSVLPNSTPFYSGDLFGYATRAVEALLAQAGANDVVVGIANGIEGDVTAARNGPGRREAHRLGMLLGGHIAQQWAELGEHLGDATLRVAYRELEFAAAKVSRPAARPTLCGRPELGTPSGGGASDHPTLIRFFPQYNPGAHIALPAGCHGPKLQIQMLDGDTTAGKQFPGIAPIAIVETGGLAIVTEPAELTTTVGSEVRTAVADALGHPACTEPDPALADKSGCHARGVAVVGLANEYMQYVASAAEYELQLYEGASTLYGPQSAQFLIDQSSCLAASFDQHKDQCACRRGQSREVDEVGVVRYPKQGSQDYLWRDAPPASEIEQIVDTRRCLTRDAQVAFEVDFKGPEPRRVKSTDDLRVEVQNEASVAIERDREMSVATRYDARTKLWTATWVPDLVFGGAPDGRYKIILHGRGVPRSSTVSWSKQDAPPPSSKVCP